MNCTRVLSRELNEYVTGSYLSCLLFLIYVWLQGTMQWNLSADMRNDVTMGELWAQFGFFGYSYNERETHMTDSSRGALENILNPPLLCQCRELDPLDKRA